MDLADRWGGGWGREYQPKPNQMKLSEQQRQRRQQGGEGGERRGRVGWQAGSMRVVERSPEEGLFTVACVYCHACVAIHGAIFHGVPQSFQPAAVVRRRTP